MRDKLNGAIVGAACTAFIVLLSVGFGFFLGERTETGSNPAESEAEAPIANLTASDSISIPGFEQITLAEGKTLQEVRLYNPPTNPCYFVISLFLPDGAEIYRSGLLPPGNEVVAVFEDGNTTPTEYGYIVASGSAGDDTIDGTYTGTVYFKIAVEPT